MIGKNFPNNSLESVKKYMRNEEKGIVDLACSLINAKTENPPGDEILAVRIVEDFFKSLQIPYKIFQKTKDRVSAVPCRTGLAAAGVRRPDAG